MSKKSKLQNKSKWLKPNKHYKFYIGQLIKGYTHSIGDYHNDINDVKKRKFLGNAKLRVGVIIKKYSNNYFMVQFRNSASENRLKNKANIINIKDSNGNKIIDLCGTSAYCIILERNRINSYFKENTYIDSNYDVFIKNIIKKLPKNRRNSDKYFEERKFTKEPYNQTKYIIRKTQYFDHQLVLDEDKAREKIELLSLRHLNKRITCVENELKKIRKVLDFVYKPELITIKNKSIYEIEKEMVIENNFYNENGLIIKINSNKSKLKNNKNLDKPKTYVDQQIKKLDDIVKELMLNPKGVIKIKNNDQSYQDNKHEETKENLIKSNIIKKEPDNRER